MSRNVDRTPITFSQLEQKVRQLAAENPDFVYPLGQGVSSIFRCVYNATQDKPACIFGRAFAELGHPVPKSEEGTDIGSVAVDMLADGENLLDFGQRRYWLMTVQQRQDEGKTWEWAVAEADRVCPLNQEAK